MPVSRQRAPIRPLLVDEGLENVRQQSRAHGARENMRAETPDRLLRSAGEQKAQSGQSQEAHAKGTAETHKRYLALRIAQPESRLGVTGLNSTQLYTLNELPQPQVDFTCGLLNLKPAPSKVST